MRVSLFVFIISFFIFQAYSQPGPAFMFQLDITNFQRPENIYLAISSGSQFELMDSMICRDGKVLFVKSTPPTVGLYRVIWGDDHYVEFIINKEKMVHLVTDDLDPERSVNVIVSEENKQFIPVLKLKDKIDSLVSVGDKIYATQKNPEKFASLRYKIDSLRKEIKLKLDKMPHAFFAYKIINASIIPDLFEYSQKNPEHGYATEADFLRRHCFDNVDKEDSNLVNTPVIYEICSFYLRNLVKEDNLDSYKKAVDFIISSFSRNDAQFTYVIDLMLSTFEKEEFDEVYLHIYDTYMSHSSCEGGIPGDNERKALSIRNLRKGTVAPYLAGLDLENDSVVLSSYKGKPVLVFFWASSCSHCKEIMPIVKDIYKVYHPKGLEILAFAIDTVPAEVEKAMIINEMKFPVLSDFKGYDGKSAIAWCVWGTPTFFLIDKDGIIYSKPSSNNVLLRDIKALIVAQ